MKVLYVTIGGPGTGSTRVRVLNYLAMLREAGIETRVVVAPQGRAILRSPIWKTLFWGEVVVVQKAFLSPVLRALLGLGGRPRLYDVDDALFAAPAYIVASARQRARMARQTDAMLLWSDVVCVANPYLGHYARKFNPSVVTIPQAIDCAKFRPPTDPGGPRDVPVLGWVGAADNRHFENFKLLAEPLARIAQKRPFVLRLIGMRKDERYARLLENVEGIRVETVGWQTSADHVPPEIQRLDVGLAPLIEDAWTLGKNPGKVLEYMACGVLPVASAVGMQREFIQDGVNGFLVSSAEEWVEKIEYALSGSAALATMRQRAVETIRTGYSIEVCGQRVLEMLTQAGRLSQHDLARTRQARRLHLQAQSSG